MNRVIGWLRTGFGDLLIKFNNKFEWLLDKLDWNSTLYYILALALGLVLGLLAMRLIKPLSALLLGVCGYGAGVRIFQYLTANVSFMEKCPDWSKYVLAGVLAVVLAILGWSKCLHVVVAGYAVIGFYLAINYVTKSIWIGVAGAVLFALIAACVVRFAFIVFASGASAYVLVLSLGKLLPKVEWLQVASAERVIPICVVCVVALVFILIQSETTRSYEC